jgi:hypothetical protein
VTTAKFNKKQNSHQAINKPKVIRVSGGRAAQIRQLRTGMYHAICYGSWYMALAIKCFDCENEAGSYYQPNGDCRLKGICTVIMASRQYLGNSIQLTKEMQVAFAMRYSVAVLETLLVRRPST